MVPGIGPVHEPVHPISLVKHGIQIVENINLEELAAAHIYEFLFVCLPLKLGGHWLAGATHRYRIPVADGRGCTKERFVGGRGSCFHAAIVSPWTGGT
jgi:hypothetical protein